MRSHSRAVPSPAGRRALLLVLIVYLSIAVSPLVVAGQNVGSAGTIAGTVTDPSGAVIPGATVTIYNPVSQYQRTASTNSSGDFSFTNVPFNPYHMTVVAKGFAAYVHDVDVRAVVPINLKISLKISTGTQTVTVTAQSNDLIETTPTNHTDIDRSMFSKLPLESQSSSLSSLVTLASPGIAADSNGLFHGMGSHASNSFSIDGQPITDQQSKVFSNEMPVSAVQSMEVIPGAPPAEYGGKTSVVIVANTRSGQGMTTPHGDVYADYGAFGTVNGGFNFGYGGQSWGNFISANGLNTGRFLDPPEFTVMHDKGNEENVFDRVDYQFSKADSIHVNLGFSRSWFQTPNSFDAEDATAWYGLRWATPPWRSTMTGSHPPQRRAARVRRTAVNWSAPPISARKSGLSMWHRPGRI